MDDSKLLQESNLAARQPCRAPHYVIQATMSEGLAQGLKVKVHFSTFFKRIESPYWTHFKHTNGIAYNQATIL